MSQNPKGDAGGDSSASEKSAAGRGATAADVDGPTTLQYLAGILIIGASAGLTLYTKKTKSMLNQMERVSKSQAQRKGPPKFGPKTKEQHEKTRPGLDNDDIF
mmetsp:Transcript_18759/g.40635  ORF Transcript_18759/g.40635 Transcript_18759/m.40635 type:complete len:103 (+) Transcript_18759:163-471(+)|eukprot:CAMPEP_0178497326 /NCGR_PEP_ID=MMETSP0696-20121128/14620_1 /TAXON_ID=265572 /ORGANISM="Extubocellulus spinifer, Strain CCMP396" /LENGTH=102 /DNA_ID=CAMNT_0020125727 /DNA_START=178 /DNA_END=486 /DNA_ORIENTATION=+